MSPHHPATCQLPLAQGERAPEFPTSWGYLVRHTLPPLEWLFGHHLLLVDLVLICKVAAEKARPHVFSAFSAGDCVGVPIGGWCASRAHPSVGVGRELESDFAWRACHCLRLLGVGFNKV